MPELTGMLLIVVALALLFDFSNGWHDSANAIATVVSTRVVSPFVAVMAAGVLNVAGAFMSTAVAKMVGSGIVNPAFLTQENGGGSAGRRHCVESLHAVIRTADQLVSRINRRTGRGCGDPWWMGHREVVRPSTGDGSHGACAVFRLCHRIFVDGGDQLDLLSRDSERGQSVVQTAPACIRLFHGVQPWRQRCTESHGDYYVGITLRGSDLFE